MEAEEEQSQEKLAELVYDCYCELLRAGFDDRVALFLVLLLQYRQLLLDRY